MLLLLHNRSPEGSPVREKMLYASTKATLKKEFGSGSIVSDFFASNHEEASLASYRAHQARKKAEENGEHDHNLLTAQEQDLAQVKVRIGIYYCMHCFIALFAKRVYSLYRSRRPCPRRASRPNRTGHCPVSSSQSTKMLSTRYLT